MRDSVVRLQGRNGQPPGRKGIKLTIRDLTSWAGLVRGVSAFAFCRRASVAVESVAYVAFVVAMTGTAFEIVKSFNVGDTLERAAYAVARDHVLHNTMPGDNAALIARARDAIREEAGGALNPDAVDIEFKVYLNPSKMLNDEVSTGKHAGIGGGPGDMVVVRLTYKTTTGFAWLRRQLGLNDGDELGFGALAVARNELALPVSSGSGGQLGSP